MDDKEKIKAAIIMLKRLKKMVGFFMKKEISELIESLEGQKFGMVRNNDTSPSCKRE